MWNEKRRQTFGAAKLNLNVSHTCIPISILFHDLVLRELHLVASQRKTDNYTTGEIRWKNEAPKWKGMSRWGSGNERYIMSGTRAVSLSLAACDALLFDSSLRSVSCCIICLSRASGGSQKIGEREMRIAHLVIAFFFLLQQHATDRFLI